jgi:hypothetical protein
VERTRRERKSDGPLLIARLSDRVCLCCVDVRRMGRIRNALNIASDRRREARDVKNGFQRRGRLEASCDVDPGCAAIDGRLHHACVLVPPLP